MADVVQLNAALAGPQHCEGDQGVATAAIQGPHSLYGKIHAWGLVCNGNGAPLANLNNAVKILEHDPALAGLVWFDTFTQRLRTGEPARDWIDADDDNLQLYMQRVVGIDRMGRETVVQSVRVVAYRSPRDCLREFIEMLPEWDRTARCDHFFADVFGATASSYCLAVGGNFWKSLIVRALRPGVKVDNMIVLEGAQGKRKSSALAAIVGDEWFAEASENVTDKDFFQSLQGKWLIEIAELDAFGRSDVTAIKRVITCRSDRFRPSYGRAAVDHPRRSVLAGTVNHDGYNKDETGARRFWPIKCGRDAEVRVDLIEANRLQYMAEARARIARDESWWEMPTDETLIEQHARRDADAWEAPIAEWLVGRDERVTVADVLIDALGIEVGRISRSDQIRVSKALRGLKWEPVDGWLKGKKAKYWIRSEGERKDLAQ